MYGFDGVPLGAQPTQATSGVVGAATSTSTLAAVVGKTNYLEGIMIGGAGATAAGNVNLTIVGLLGGTITIPIAIPAGVNAGVGPFIIKFPRPLAASGPNIAIVVSAPTYGAGNTKAVNAAWGYIK